MNLTSDICLATVVNSTKLTCVSRNITTSHNWISIPITKTGVYTLIFNPRDALKSDHDVTPTTTITIAPSSETTTEIMEITTMTSE
jgi:hypothetical protein